jgi:hypothetical protein
MYEEKIETTTFAPFSPAVIEVVENNYRNEESSFETVLPNLYLMAIIWILVL